MNEKFNNSNNIEGVWVKYDQGSDYTVLLNSIGSYTTGWSVNKVSECKKQIENGDFYVYYTKDDDGNYKVPRLAIGMNNDNISLIKGVASFQNIEPHFEEILDKKLDEFKDKDKYIQIINDVKMLTYVYTKYQLNKELTRNDLRFLYEIDKNIVGFGYGPDVRIKEILRDRDISKDLNTMFDPDEVIEKDLDLQGLVDIEKVVLPKKVEGTLYMGGLISAKNVVFPKEVTGTVILGDIKSASDVVLPEVVGENLYLGNLESVDEVTFPKEVGGSLILGLTNTEGFVPPKKIGGSLVLDSITNAKDLVLPEVINYNLDLSGITSAEDLVLPKVIKGSLNLDKLTSAKGLTLPEEIDGSLTMYSLKDAEGLALPKVIGKNLYLRSLKNLKGLKLPEKLGGDLLLDSVMSDCDLDVSNCEINGDIYFMDRPVDPNLKKIKR